jgi:hypothetical protein
VGRVGWGEGGGGGTDKSLCFQEPINSEIVQHKFNLLRFVVHNPTHEILALTEIIYFLVVVPTCTGRKRSNILDCFLNNSTLGHLPTLSFLLMHFMKDM